jgi:hypothetical protein
MAKGPLENKLQFEKKNKDLIKLPKREPFPSKRPGSDNAGTKDHKR